MEQLKGAQKLLRTWPRRYSRQLAVFNVGEQAAYFIGSVRWYSIMAPVCIHMYYEHLEENTMSFRFDCGSLKAVSTRLLAFQGPM